MALESDHLSLRLARDARDLRAAQRLRYEVFVAELGADGADVDHDARLECDAFDSRCDHLLLIDARRDPAKLEDVVGAYRLLPADRLHPGERFYTEGEYDLTGLRATGRRMLELGRSCVHPDLRGGPALFMLWNGLADYVRTHRIEVLFGTASFHGTDPVRVAPALAWLHRNHLALPELRPCALPTGYLDMNLLTDQQIDRRSAMALMPSLLKAYLRLGGCVGEGAYIDRAFNTIDVCLVVDTAQMSARHLELYSRGAAGGSEPEGA